MTKKFLVDIKCTGLTKEQAPGFEKFILILWPCPQTSRNLWPNLLATPVRKWLNLQKPDNWQPIEKDGKPKHDWGPLASSSDKIANWHRRRESTSFRMRNLAFDFGNGKAIILIRNPYDAVISLWTHQFLDGNVRE